MTSIVSTTGVRGAAGLETEPDVGRAPAVGGVGRGYTGRVGDGGGGDACLAQRAVCREGLADVTVVLGPLLPSGRVVALGEVGAALGDFSLVGIPGLPC